MDFLVEFLDHLQKLVYHNENVLTLLVKNVLLPLVLAAVINRIHKKNIGSGTHDSGIATFVVISNKELEYIVEV